LTIIAARVALNPVLGREHDRHLFLLPAVILASWIGGFGAGCMATVLCAVSLSVLWTGPGFAVPQRLTVDVALFLLIGLAVSALVESQRVARAHAESAGAARDQLLAIVVHDLGNPLSTIKLAAQSLRRTALVDGSLLRTSDRIERAATRMTRLVHDLQDATQIERGTLTVETAAQPVAPLLREVVEEFSPSSVAKSVRLETAPTPAETVVWADRDRLAQVLGNLVGNALRFTPSGGSIHLQAEERDSVVVFAVKDTGPGIAPEDAPHVFERFWKTKSTGTGLGLFIAQGIVRAHGGNLDVQSTPGMGATFSFTIPRAAARAGATASA
jgi:signal transduction histidine kinase